MTIWAGIIYMNDTLVGSGIYIPAWLTQAGLVAGAVGAVVSKFSVDWVAKRTADKAAALLSPWYVSVLAIISLARSWLGWVTLSIALALAFYTPVFYWLDKT